VRQHDGFWITLLSVRGPPGGHHTALLAHERLEAVMVHGQMDTVVLERCTLHPQVPAQQGGVLAQRCCPDSDVLPILVSHHSDPFHPLQALVSA